jgi:hypothetical protein
MVRRDHRWRVLVSGLALTATACGGGGKPAASGAPTPTTESSSPSVSESPTETLEPSDSEEPTDVEESTPEETTTTSAPPVVPTNASGRALTLADVFGTEGEWEESRYDVATRTEVQGIGTQLNACGEDDAHEIELRLAHRFSRLTMNVGQANDSASSDETLVVQIVTNGKLEDTRRVPFDRIQQFAVNVKDVNALKLRFWIDEVECAYRDGIIAVIEKLTVFG